MPSKQLLRIGFVLDDTLDTPDGVQQYVLTLGKWLSSQGHDVHYLVGESSRKDIDNVHSMARNVRVRFNKNRLSIPLPTRKSQIVQKLAQLDLDVLHVQMPYSPMFAGRVISCALELGSRKIPVTPGTPQPSNDYFSTVGVASATPPPDIIAPESVVGAPVGNEVSRNTSKRTKIIGTFHIVPASWLHSAGARSLELVNRRTLKHFDKIISVSPAASQFANTVFGIKSVIIPNVVDEKAMRHAPILNKVPHIVFLGRLVERKGCQYLLKALKVLQEKYSGEYRVTIAGKGPLADKLIKWATKNNLKNTTFTGYLAEPDKPKLLASADIAVFPSTGGESFGIVLIEAMAAGARVVLGGDNVGYRSVLGDYPDLLVDPHDSLAFADKLQYFLQNSAASAAASAWAKKAIKQYEVAVVGTKILEIYRADK